MALEAAVNPQRDRRRVLQGSPPVRVTLHMFTLTRDAMIKQGTFLFVVVLSAASLGVFAYPLETVYSSSYKVSPDLGETPAVNCDPPHHTAAPFLDQMVGSEEARLYANMAQTIVMAMKIAECGDRWFFVLYYNGKFHTNFFPANGWAYISKQIGTYGLSLIT